jgi:ubiquinone/menaquinone biosynthesis C-methylase UbiE
MAIDPVCKMVVDEQKARFTSSHGDRKFFFCSANCKATFDKQPRKYAVHSNAETEKFARMLDSEERRQWQEPVRIIKEIGVSEGMVIADLACGPGFFTMPMADVIGRKGKIYAVDSNPMMLQHLRVKKEKSGLPKETIEIVEADVSDTKIAPGSVDLVLIADAFHDLDDTQGVLKEIRRIAKPNSMMVDIDWHKVATEHGPPVGARVSESDARRILAENGFEVTRTVYGGPSHYGLVCRVIPE